MKTKKDNWLREALRIAAKFERENPEFVKAALKSWNETRSSKT